MGDAFEDVVGEGGSGPRCAAHEGYPLALLAKERDDRVEARGHRTQAQGAAAEALGGGGERRQTLPIDGAHAPQVPLEVSTRDEPGCLARGAPSASGDR
jgi:hypothetical protein